MTYFVELTNSGGRDLGLWHSVSGTGRAAILLGNTPQGWYGSASGQPRRLVADGYSVVTVATANWGNSTDVASIDAALTWLGARGVNTDQVLVVAHGRGAVAALNWALRNPARVAGMSLQSPIIDLAERWTRVTADRTSLQAAYGGSQATFDAAMPTWNPGHVEHRRMLVRGLLGDRLKVWWSSADTDTPPSVTSALATAFRCETGTLASADSTVADPATVLDATATAAAAWDQRPARLQTAGFRGWMEASPNSQGDKGGDAKRSTLLENGNSFWTTADNLVGTIDADGTYGGALPRRNAIIIVTPGGTYSQAYAVGGGAPFPESDPWFWPICSCLEGSTLQVAGWRVTAGGNFGHLVDNVVYSLDPTALPTVTITATTAMGMTDETFMVAGLLVDGSWIYILGQEYVGGYDAYSVSTVTRTRLARCPLGSLTTLSTWQYWDGDNWVTDRSAAAPLTTADGAVIEGDTCLRRTPRGFVLAAMGPTEGAIRLLRSGWPQRDWTLYHTEAVLELGDTRYNVTGVGYHPAWHPQHDPSASELMLSWNGNLFGSGGVALSDQDPDWYGPHFKNLPAPPFDL